MRILRIILWTSVASFSSASLRGTNRDHDRMEQQDLRELQTPSVSLYLIDADTNLELGSIQNGKVFALPMSVKNLNVEARPSASITPVDKVQFGWQKTATFRTESTSPYAFCGDTKGDFTACSQLVINNIPTKVSATVVSGGINVASITVTFTLQYSATGPTPVSTPVTPPVASPVAAPVKAPVTSPVSLPVTAPVRPPVTSPVTPPIAAPVKPPSPPTSSAVLPWIEDFEQAAGTMQDTGSTAWTAQRTGTGAVFATDGNGSFQINNGGSVGVWTSASINISSAAAGVDISLRLRSSGPLEANQDYVQMYARVDNGLEVLIGERRGTTASGTTIAKLGVKGSSLVIIIRAYTSFSDEYLYLEQVSVSPSIGSEPMAPPVTAPVAAPIALPPTSFNLNGAWKLLNAQPFVPRHEACFAMVGDKAFLMGGRETQDVDIYNPATGTWSKGKPAPIKLHHMQCVGVKGKIYLPAAWTSSFPEEKTPDVMWVYDTVANNWYSEAAMPLYRRRGSAAIVVDGDKIWISHGNIGGHEQNNFATSYGWIDYYDTVTKTWVMGDKAGFPDAPNPRDHTGGALVKGRICVAGGRNGGADSSWPAVAPTDCFDPATKTWTVEANIPLNRSGSSYGTSCDGRLMIAGGERSMTNRVDVFDGKSWQTFQNGLNVARHGSGLAVDCARNKIYIASGSPNGGGGNTDSMEIYTPA